MNEHSEHAEYEYPAEDYGQDHYAEGEGQAEEYAADEGFDQSQLPVQDHRSFMQKYGNLVIFGGVGIVIVVMGYVTFAPMLASRPAAQTTAMQASADASSLLKPVTQSNGMAPAATPTDNSAHNAPVIATAPMPAPTVPTPGANAIGVSPTAPVTNNAAAPSNANDPWTQTANGTSAPAPATPPAPAAVPEPAAVTAAPVTPPAAAVDTQKLQDLQQKLDQAEAQRQDQTATIAELQNRLAEAEAKVTAMQQQQAAAVQVPDADTNAPVKAKTKSPHTAKTKTDAGAAPEEQASAKTPQTWELRSASDGVAWVSRASDNQLYRVAVGDELPGIGRITAIRPMGDAWVVVGTGGQIRQE